MSENKQEKIDDLKKKIKLLKDRGIHGCFEGMALQAFRRALENLEFEHLPRFDRYCSNIEKAGNQGQFIKYGWGGNDNLIKAGSFEKLVNILHGLDNTDDMVTSSQHNGSFSKLTKLSGEEYTWAIISASDWRHSGSEENIIRNAKLREAFKAQGIGVLILAGLLNAAGEAKGVVEHNFADIKPREMPADKFKEILCELMTIDGKTQDGFLISYGKESGHEAGEFWVNSDRTETVIGYKSCAEDINKAFGDHYYFLGVECPSSKNDAETFIANKVFYLNLL